MSDLRTAALRVLEALGLWATGRDMDAVALNDLIFRLEAALAEPVQEPASKMTAGRAAYFMARFKREEKMLGPNEQAALDFVISMLEAALAEPAQEPAYKVKITGRWHDAEPFAAAFSLPDGEHMLYTAPPQRSATV